MINTSPRTRNHTRGHTSSESIWFWGFLCSPIIPTSERQMLRPFLAVLVTGSTEASTRQAEPGPLREATPGGPSPRAGPTSALLKAGEEQSRPGLGSNRRAQSRDREAWSRKWSRQQAGWGRAAQGHG